MSLRGSVKETYFSDAMAQKLHATLLECKAKGGHSRTYGALDPVQVTLMAPHLTSIYVSGWQSSSTASTVRRALAPSRLPFHTAPPGHAAVQ